jgi:hypothetical protein
MDEALRDLLVSFVVPYVPTTSINYDLRYKLKLLLQNA